MDARYLNADDWQAFEQRFPRAAQWLRMANLKEERRILRVELSMPEIDTRRKKWIEGRLAELDWFFNDLGLQEDKNEPE